MDRSVDGWLEMLRKSVRVIHHGAVCKPARWGVTMKVFSLPSISPGASWAFRLKANCTAVHYDLDRSTPSLNSRIELALVLERQILDVLSKAEADRHLALCVL